MCKVMSMGDDIMCEDNCLGEVIFVLFAVIVMGIVIGYGINYTKEIGYDKMGEMICSEKGNYEFNKFDRYTNTVICKEINVEKYDGGYIKI